MSLKDVQSHVGDELSHLEALKAEINGLIGEGGSGTPPTSSQLPIHLHYKIFRDYAEHEDGLVNNRLMWNITIQGFLFATHGLSVQKLAEVQASQGGAESIGGIGVFALRGLLIILPVLGGVVSYYSWRGVRAAQKAISRLEDTWATIAQPPNGPRLPGLTGGGDKSNHTEGFLAPKVFPWIFVVAWGLLLFSYLGPWFWWKLFGRL
jgi:hypothetical protein